MSIKEDKIFERLKTYLRFLPFIFIVSQVEVLKQKGLTEEFEVAVFRADGKKCSRCWNYSPTVDTFKDYPGICDRCVEAIK